jgi:hypothetical protein
VPSWDEEEWWDDRDEPAFERVRRPRRSRDEPDEPGAPDEPTVPVSMQVELEGSVYRIPTALWWFTVTNRRDRPGVCVRCDLPARVAVLCPGRDPDSPWSLAATVILIEPTANNGLTKSTAFALTPWPVDIRMLQLIHNAGERMGRLEGHVYAQIRRHIDWLEGLYPEARQ